ncbi:MAG: manganese efflux pump MntP family protein [Lachnospiraceae bacterium]|nr:manganese efflux pump MntP family protein [Lachnospiraceae bacterium]
MGFIELFLIGTGLSMDAFAAAVCKGLGMSKGTKKNRYFDKHNAAVIALFFGGFQAIMPFIGWLLGKQFEHHIVSFDHWIAFALLTFLGVKTIREVLTDNEREVCITSDLDIKELFLLAIATSIDALAVGITFAFLQVNILRAVSAIGITTFTFSMVGVFVGFKFGGKFEKQAELIGGIILITIGLKILLEHTGIINF